MPFKRVRWSIILCWGYIWIIVIRVMYHCDQSTFDPRATLGLFQLQEYWPLCIIVKLINIWFKCKISWNKRTCKIKCVDNICILICSQIIRFLNQWWIDKFIPLKLHRTSVKASPVTGNSTSYSTAYSGVKQIIIKAIHITRLLLWDGWIP